MTTPAGKKELWKNCTWKTEAEKLAFFNHYFKKSSMVENRIASKVKKFKDNVIEFIQEGTIKEGNNERPITIKDILNTVKGI